jgi:hypothetical protein
MIRSNHLIFDTTFLRVEQYRNFGDPHVATITVEDAQFAENSVPYEEGRCEKQQCMLLF